MKSATGETVQLSEIVSATKTDNQIEKWLLELERVMMSTIHKIISESIVTYKKQSRTDWVRSSIGEVVLPISMFYWTQSVHRAIAEGQQVKEIN